MQRMVLSNRKDRTVDTKRANGLSGLLFRHVKPGKGYRVAPRKGGAGELVPVGLFGFEELLDKAKSERLRPELSLRKEDERPLPSDRFARATIRLYYEGHAYRAGSRIRVTISAPNGDQPVWSFAKTKPRKGAPKVAIASSKRKPSKLTLPVVEGLDVPTELPPCPGVRGQPCRDYEPPR